MGAPMGVLLYCPFLIRLTTFKPADIQGLRYIYRCIARHLFYERAEGPLTHTRYLCLIPPSAMTVILMRWSFTTRIDYPPKLAQCLKEPHLLRNRKTMFPPPWECCQSPGRQGLRQNL